MTVKKTTTMLICTILLIMAVFCVMPMDAPNACALPMDDEAQEEKHIPQADGVLTDTVQLYKSNDWGDYYLNNDVFVCVPKTVTTETKLCVYYAGGCGGSVIDFGWFDRYFRAFQPDAVFVLYKNSNIYQIGTATDSIEERTAEMLGVISNTFGFLPKEIEVAGSSNGGYTTFHVACYLYRNYGIVTDEIMILDMGNNWYTEDKLISESDAKPMLDMGTTVYHFGRAKEIYIMPGAVKFAGYGVKLVEVECGSGNHDAITRNAIACGMFSWLIGEPYEINTKAYTFRNVN